MDSSTETKQTEAENLFYEGGEIGTLMRSHDWSQTLLGSVDSWDVSLITTVDREMWEKIVFNLISNAFKFTFRGEIIVSLHQIGDKVELKVQDTGCGISPEELAQIFQRFHRIRSVQARSYEGSGIGLALVQELVNLHGATINVSSVLGKGTTFTVTLPIGSSHLPSDQISIKHTQVSNSISAIPYVQEMKQWVSKEEGERHV